MKIYVEDPEAEIW